MVVVVGGWNQVLTSWRTRTKTSLADGMHRTAQAEVWTYETQEALNKKLCYWLRWEEVGFSWAAWAFVQQFISFSNWRRLQRIHQTERRSCWIKGFKMRTFMKKRIQAILFKWTWCNFTQSRWGGGVSFSGKWSSWGRVGDMQWPAIALNGDTSCMKRAQQRVE